RRRTLLQPAARTTAGAATTPPVTARSRRPPRRRGTRRRDRPAGWARKRCPRSGRGAPGRAVALPRFPLPSRQGRRAPPAAAVLSPGRDSPRAGRSWWPGRRLFAPPAELTGRAPPEAAPARGPAPASTLLPPRAGSGPGGRRA